MELKIGDGVVLRNGESPVMTVYSEQTAESAMVSVGGTGKIRCVWFYNGRLEVEEFPIGTLKKVGGPNVEDQATTG